MRRFSSAALLLWLWLPACCFAASSWTKLFNGKNLDGWQTVGDGVWTVLKDGTLVGQRDLRRAEWLPSARQQQEWRDLQAWLYTIKEYGEFDLALEFWTRRGGNSGVSIRDISRAKYAISRPVDFTRTPSKIGYEIQINNQYPDKHLTGSIYTFAVARPGAQIDDEWNAMEISVRDDVIRVKLNGQPVCESATDPKRSKTGPVGLQLHDQYSVVMFRDVRIREVR
jgi:hypothetical protein